MTHALSAVALLMIIFVMSPHIIAKALHGDTQPAYLILLLLVAVGGALMPDLDNTNSSAKSALGVIGVGISGFMRFTAPVIQGLLHTKYDKDYDNPHRGFYHTALSSILFGGLTWLLCSDIIDIPVSGSFHINGKMFALIIVFIGSHIALSTLGKPIMKKVSHAAGVIGFIMPTLLSLAIVGVLWSQLSNATDYRSVGLAFGLGWLIHILGDMCTTQGVPVLFPIPIKGKLWWHVRLLPIKAGGAAENYLFIPAFIIIIVACTVILLL